MAGRTAYRPRRAEIHGEQDVRAELKRQTASRGIVKGLAADAGLHISAVYEMRAGRRLMTPSLAEQLGFTLAWVRAEELALADKIETELSQPAALKER